jgi:sterol desaturase/sphingolipid hydroxylase (fatty acid hydroxylase superfamily)
MPWEFLSPCLIATSAVILVTLEHLFPYEPRQRLFRVGFFTDFFWYTLVQSYVLGLVIKVIIVALDQTKGIFPRHLVSGWPVLLQLAFFWVTHDFYIYWFHRTQHRSRWLWRVHEAHHSGKDVDWLSGSRSHALEILINQTIEYAPILLLGAHPDVALMKGVLDATWGMYIHSNIDVRAGWLQYVLNGPQMHRWHHADELDRRSVNFATKIAVWDWLFRTAWLPQHKPRNYGLWDRSPFPERSGWRGAAFDYFAQSAWAFRAFEVDAKASREVDPKASRELDPKASREVLAATGAPPRGPLRVASLPAQEDHE